MKVSTDAQKIEHLLTHQVDEVIVRESLEKKLKSGKLLRIKFGADPSRPDLHIGHAVVLRKLCEFQELGHTVIFLIGDFTALIGDPSGKSKTRPMLSEKEIKANAKTYFAQVGKVLDTRKGEVRYNSEWLGKMKAADFIKLVSQFTAARILERDDFAARMKEHADVHMHELLYPMLQAQDSIALEADVEIGATDQKFNLLAGRDLQRKLGKPEQDILTTPILVGTDGVKKMSKSLDNYIGITESPEEMFGKTMSIPDLALLNWIQLAADYSDEDIQRETGQINSHPMDVKIRLAQRIVTMYHGEEKGRKAAQGFIDRFRNKEAPKDMPLKIMVNFTQVNATGVSAELFGLSNSEARRLIEQGGIKVNGEVVTDPNKKFTETPEEGLVWQKGKLQFVRVKGKKQLMYLIRTIKSEIKTAIAEVLTGLDSILPSSEFGYPEDPKNGDITYKCFKASVIWSAQKTAVEIAKLVAEKIKLPNFVIKAEAAGPYLNFFLDTNFLIRNSLKEVLDKGEDYGKNYRQTTPENVMVEYVSPNNNKPLHLGHVRNGLIGSAVSNLLESQGHKVTRTLILNDRGLAIAKAMVTYAKWGDGKTPESRGTKGDHFVAEYYVMYEMKFKEDATLEEAAHEVIRKWEAGDAETRKLWKMMNDWCEAGQHETYKKFGFHFDIEYKESDIYKEGKDIIAQGIKKGVFVKDETGATVAKLEAHGLPDKVVLRGDGTSLYITQDLALAKMRVEEYKLDEMVYVVGNEQNLQFKQIFKILELLGYPWASKLHHLSYGYVSLPEGRMKSREGTVVDADDLLTLLETDAMVELKQRYPTLPDDEADRRAKMIALAAVKFYFLEVDITSDMTYDPKASLSFTGRTGPYLQYMHARVSSILRKAETEAHAAAYEGRNATDDEKTLALAIAKWPETVRNAAQSYRPSLVALHLYDLAKSFASFYENDQVLNASEEDRAARLGLISAVQTVLRNGLTLLGISAPEEM